jgi:hypothetical protein
VLYGLAGSTLFLAHLAPLADFLPFMRDTGSSVTVRSARQFAEPVLRTGSILFSELCCVGAMGPIFRRPSASCCNSVFVALSDRGVFIYYAWVHSI